jgi:hypothetical protein
MTHSEPWTVRHLYSAVDPEFGPYLDRMRELLHQAGEAGWIHEHHEVALCDDTEILPALSKVGFGELVVIDLHGWAAADDPARLGTRSTGPYAQLADLPAASCRAAAIMLGNCRGGRSQFLDAVARLVRRPTAVAYCFDGAYHRDHSPVAIVNEILGTAPAADDHEARRAMDVAIYNHRATARAHEHVKPALFDA